MGKKRKTQTEPSSGQAYMPMSWKIPVFVCVLGFLIIMGSAVYNSVQSVDSVAHLSRVKQGDCVVWHQHLLWIKEVKDDHDEAVLFDFTDNPPVVYVIPRGELLTGVICPTKEK